eukprot:COSAG02_NODE_5351_length_4407_cov_4.772516_5_plen_109_part_00
MHYRTYREFVSLVLGATSLKTIIKLAHQTPSAEPDTAAPHHWMGVCHRIATAIISAAPAVGQVLDYASVCLEIAIHLIGMCAHKAETAPSTMKPWCVVPTAVSIRMSV